MRYSDQLRSILIAVLSSGGFLAHLRSTILKVTLLDAFIAGSTEYFIMFSFSIVPGFSDCPPLVR